MARESIRIGTGSGWWGDRIEPATAVVARGALDYLCFETMAEATLSAAQVRARRDPSKHVNIFTGEVASVNATTARTIKEPATC